MDVNSTKSYFEFVTTAREGKATDLEKELGRVSSALMLELQQPLPCLLPPARQQHVLHLPPFQGQAHDLHGQQC